jgi:Zn-dependent peptidase ImmA (M78 family)
VLGRGTSRCTLVVYNPTQASARINSVVMHELAHIMLGHDLADGHVTDDGYFLNGNYDGDQEQEADWLGGTLLLPRPALLWIRSKGMTDAAASTHYGVSLQMLKWRIRMTGVDYQLRGTA